MSASPDGIVAIDDAGRIRFCNPAVEDLFGRPVSRLIGTAFGYPIVAGEVTEVELMQPGGGWRVVEMQVTDTRVEGDHLFVAALRDVTRRKLSERRLEAELERQHTEVAVAVHALRSPLTAIAALTHVLRDPPSALSEEQRNEIVDRIAARTARLQGLVRKLTVASKIDAGHGSARRTSVPVLEVVLERLSDLDERSAWVTVECAADLAVLVNRGELAEMLENYLENAFLHGRPPIEVRVTGEDEWVDVRVSDSGPGVPPAFVPHVFERFARDPAMERRTEGSGLGLWIVRSLARENGGEAYYEEGEGACFGLRLRRAP